MANTENIQMCLECTKPNCNNCQGSTNTGKRAKRYSWQGKMLTAQELSDIAGKTRETIIHRIKKGGVAFAMSGCRNYATWKKRSGNEKQEENPNEQPRCKDCAFRIDRVGEAKKGFKNVCTAGHGYKRDNDFCDDFYDEELQRQQSMEVKHEHTK